MSFYYPTFLELLSCHDEFAFIYNGVKYEIVYCDEGGNPKLSLYLADSEHGTFIKSFDNVEEFLQNAKLDGKNVSQILDEIKFP